jgi:hypothetical protein
MILNMSEVLVPRCKTYDKQLGFSRCIPAGVAGVSAVNMSQFVCMYDRLVSRYRESMLKSTLHHLYCCAKIATSGSARYNITIFMIVVIHSA